MDGAKFIVHDATDNTSSQVSLTWTVSYFNT